MQVSDRIPLNAEVPIAALQKYVDVWHRHAGPEYQINDPELSHFLEVNLGRSEINVLTEVNRYVNSRIIYRHEPESEDKWQTPEETLKLGTGDCEDIALLKADILGWFNLSGMEIDLLLVHVRQTRDDHAILLVRDNLVLDCRSDGVHYLTELKPYYELRCAIGARGYKSFKPDEGGQNVPSV